MITPGYRLILLFPATGGPFRFGVPYQARMETPPPEFHPPGDPRPDLLGPADAQRLFENDVGEDEASLGVPTPAKNPLPFHCQYGREAAPHYS